ASGSTNGLMRQISGNTTDFIDGSNNSQPLQPVIWSVRLRGFNAIGNPTFEVDQRNVGTGITNIGSGVFLQDRWSNTNTAPTLRYTGGQTTGTLVIPGTSFRISNNYTYATLTAKQ